MRRLALIVHFLTRAWRRVMMLVMRSLFRKCGRNVIFGDGCDFSFANIEIGDDVYIGPRACFMAAISTIRIGNKVLFGPQVTIVAGDHRTGVVGSYMFDVREKLPQNDLDVVIDDDVWIGCNVLILKGVTIGRGSIVGAGSVVTKTLPPYSVYVGSPDARMWPRWNAQTIAEHEALLASRR